MLIASQVDAALEPEAIPALPGALDLFASGLESSLSPANTESLVSLTGDPVSGTAGKLLCDPQTAGGLLAGIPQDRAEACLDALQAAGDAEAAIIGHVEEMSGTTPRLRLI